MGSLTVDPFPRQKKERAQVGEQTKRWRKILRQWGTKATSSSYDRLILVREQENVGGITDICSLRYLTPSDPDWDLLFGDLEVGSGRRVTKKGHDPVFEEIDPPDLRSLCAPRGKLSPVVKVEAGQAFSASASWGDKPETVFVLTAENGERSIVSHERLVRAYRDGETLMFEGTEKPVHVFADGEVVGLVMPYRSANVVGDLVPVEWEVTA